VRTSWKDTFKEFETAIKMVRRLITLVNEKKSAVPLDRTTNTGQPVALWRPGDYPQNATVEVKPQRDGFAEGCLI